jgi:hypothetical protein
MTFSNQELKIIQSVVEFRLETLYEEPEGVELYWKPEILHNILKKIDKILEE